MHKYIEIIKYSLKENTKFIVDYIFFILGFIVHIFVFNELWDFILQNKSIEGYNRQQLMWYIIIAEIIVCCNYTKYRKIGEMVKNGDIANMLLKPIDFIYYMIAEDISVYIKLLVNIIVAIVVGIAMVGVIEISIIGILYVLISIIIAIFIGMLVQYFAGLIAFFTEENKAFWLVLQKLFLLIVFTPIEFYPSIIQKILYVLPTTYFIYTPARIISNFDIIESTILLALEIISGIIFYVVIRILYKIGVKKINVNGG